MKRLSPELVILSGMSGSGKSSALNTLEDAGWFAIDNLPGDLIPSLLELLKRPFPLSHLKKIALVMDARERFFLKNFTGTFHFLKSKRIRFRLIFLDARDDILIRRFQETRRRHPLAPSGSMSVGIRRERDLLHPLRAEASCLIDTSYLNVHQLRDKILSLLRQDRLKKELMVSVVSFGYRYGLPLEADLVMDLRFLPNPHFINSLRPLSGKNPKVQGFVFRQKATQNFMKLLNRMLPLLLGQFLKEGKAYLTIAFGCTGGRHRSVAVSEKVAQGLKRLGYPVKIQHRDIARGE